MKWLLVDTGLDKLEDLARAEFTVIDCERHVSGQPHQDDLQAGVVELFSRSERSFEERDPQRGRSIYVIPLEKARTKWVVPKAGFSIEDRVEEGAATR